MNVILIAGLVFILLIILFTLILMVSSPSSSPSSSSPLLSSLNITDGNYQIIEIPNFLSASDADQLRTLALSKGLEVSKVYSKNRDELDLTFRKSRQAWLRDPDHPLVDLLSKKIAELTGLPVSYQESLQVAVYSPGGKFDAHYDACDEKNRECQGMNRVAGPRFLTFLIYLNDDYTGGTTTFPRLSRTVKPEKGKAVVFADVDPVTKKILEKSLHAGDPLLTGEKWIANKWIHLRPYS